MKNILTYIVCMGALSLASCNDWLDVTPQSQVVSKEMFNKEAGFKDALTACYIKLNSTELYGTRLTMTDIEYLAQHWDHNSGNYRNEEELKKFNYKSSYAEETIKAIYGALYNAISQANIVLENMASTGNVITDSQVKAVIEAEALGMRAFCHMDVLRLFGQLPQHATKQVSLPYAKTVSTEAIPYYSYEDFVELILEDIRAAEALLKEHDPLMTYNFDQLDNFSDSKYGVELNDSFLGYRRFRFNYYAMEAMKARLYMYMGKKEEANAAAKAVMNAQDREGKKMLALAGADDYAEKYYALPSECILALSNSEIKSMTESLFGYNALYVSQPHFDKDLFAGQDITKNNRATTGWNASATDSQGTHKPLLMKYEQPEKTEGYKINDIVTKFQVIPLIRLSEMYLIAIETAPTLEEANTLYAEYMKARNVEAKELSQGELLDEVVKEYRREFFAEGQMFYTYKRLGYKNMLWKVDREVNENDYVVPLPATELRR